jgi:hypothetical protein
LPPDFDLLQGINNPDSVVLAKDTE